MLKRLTNKQGSGYIDVVVIVLSAILVIALATSVFPVYIAKSQLDSAQAELDRKKSEGEKELASALLQIENGKKELKKVKEELEDLSFFYLDPYAYEEIENALQMRKTDREDLIVRIKEKIVNGLGFLKVQPIIEGRVKSHYGIYKKVFLAGKSFDEIYDIYAIRVITDSVADCYNILGIMHDMFRPIPNRFKDYISTPKPNMYQSLHTTVIGRSGIPFEIQIRTFDMHHTAEFGIAAHWKYKEGIEEHKRRKGRNTASDTIRNSRRKYICFCWLFYCR